MRVKIKVGDNKVEFNMSKSQALLLVKMAQEFEKVYMNNVLATLDDADSEADEDNEIN
nr:MAG TPA: hypothetical protein [Caudoviricetes sp.]